VYLVFILDALNLHLSGGVEYIHVKDGYIGRIPTHPKILILGNLEIS
jgi:hypothetical protein